MIKKRFEVKNKAGIHCRPSSVILNTINQEFPYHSFQIETSEKKVVELNSILVLISLGLAFGAVGTLIVEGPDEVSAADKISGLLENEFDFPPQ